MTPGDIINIEGEGLCELKEFVKSYEGYEVWNVEFFDCMDRTFQRMIKTNNNDTNGC